MQNNLVDQALEKHFQERSVVNITLRDNTTLQGRVKDYDAYVVLLDTRPDTVVYRHSVLKLEGEVHHKEIRPEPRAKEKRISRPPVRPSVKPVPKEEPAPSQSGFNPMAKELLKWLDSQKGGG
jgi:RNA chaperone Hfq